MWAKGFVALSIAAACAVPAVAETTAAEGIAGLKPREARIVSAAKAKRKGKAKKAGLDKVCKKVTDLRGLLVKITAGGHIGGGEPRYSGWSIICASKCTPFPVTAYHCDGTPAFKMGYYGRWSGNGQSRGYCSSGGTGACSVSSTRAVNRRKGCKGAAYLDTDGSRGKSCMRFNINSNRNGGV